MNNHILNIEKTALVIIGIVLLSFVFLNFASAQTTSIPQWVRSTVGYWSEGKVTDNEFVSAMQFLINSNIIKISSNSTTNNSQQIAQLEQTISTLQNQLSSDNSQILSLRQQLSQQSTTYSQNNTVQNTTNTYVNGVPSSSLENQQEGNTSNKILNMPYSWTQNNFKYTLDKISLDQYGSTANMLTDGFWLYDVSVTCQNLLHSSNSMNFQAITDIKLKTNTGNTWDLKSAYGLGVCGNKFDPEESRYGVADFKIGAKEKPESLLVSTYTGEQLIFNATISK